MPAILQSEPIDIAHWHEDEQFAHYPEGARAKLAVFPNDPPDYPFIVPRRRYLFKRSRSAYPDQYWAEVVAYHVGSHLGVPVPHVYAATHGQTGEPGALIEWFYEDGPTAFVLGGHFLQRMIAGYDRKRGTQHNFQSIAKLGQVLRVDHWEHWWAKTFLFDALIGNTDRHQDNWGFLVHRSEVPARWELSPCYDHGTSLGHELFPHLISSWGPAAFRRYIARGRHHMKWKREGTRPAHVEMVQLMIGQKPELTPILREMVQNFHLGQIQTAMAHWRQFGIPVPLTEGRSNVILTLLEIRLSDLSAALR